MEKENYILAVMSFSEGSEYTPVQLQKLFFLLDKNIGEKIGGPYFNFIPYHYGPFDKEVYLLINKLKVDNLIQEYYESNLKLRKYKLTVSGYNKGFTLKKQFPEPYYSFIRNLDELVRSLTFQSLISLVYRLYPEMKLNSIFIS